MRYDLSHGGPVSPREISAMVARYRASGEPLARFADKNGIPHGRLHYWVYGRKRDKPGKPVPTAVPGPRFQEVALGTTMAVDSDWAAEVSLPGGFTVRFGAAAKPSWIAEIVQVLYRSC